MNLNKLVLLCALLLALPSSAGQVIKDGPVESGTASGTGQYIKSGPFAGFSAVGGPGGGGGGASCNRVLMGAQTPTTTKGTDDYMNLLDHTKSSAEATTLDFMVPVDMTAHDLFVYVDVAPGTSDKWRMTLRDDSSNTALTCDIDDLATECFDDENEVAISAGSILTLILDSGEGVGNPAFGSFSWAFCLDEV